jgi:hypothetical protein
VRLDDIAGARAVASHLAGQARCQYHPWGLATARRCAALIDLSAGHSEEAAAALADAATRYGTLGLRFDEARSRPSLGRAARRFKKWGTAREARGVNVIPVGDEEFLATATAGDAVHLSREAGPAETARSAVPGWQLRPRRGTSQVR